MLSLFIQKAYAQFPPSGGGGSSFDSILKSITTEIVQPIVLLLGTAALIYFLWGVYDFIKNADNANGRETGIQHIMWGLFGLVLTISVTGFISVIKNSLGIK